MLNKAILVGRLCTDPELKQTTSGVPVCTFRLAVQRAYASRGGERQTDFLSVVVWRQQAEFVSRYFHKGNMIGIDGHIETRSYTDRNNQQRTAVEIIAENVSFVESKASASGSSGSGDYSGGGSFTGNAAPVYNAPQPAPAASAGGGQQSSSSFSNGDFGDFQEIDSDEDLPF